MPAKLHAPATARNRGPILDLLKRVLPARGTVLEAASGTGEHAIHFAAGLPDLTWAPSDPDPDHVASIAAWAAEASLPNLKPPRLLDVTAADWGIADIAADLAAIVNINMIHIAPWRACEGLMAGAGRLLPPGGVLFMYGPYKRGGRHTAPSNEAFDRSLRAQDPNWGVRDLDEVAALAATHGLARQEVADMPANNLSIIYVKS